MNNRLPPPIALRSFEAAARNLSFTRAAGELNVTQAAISHQVKLLEEHLGVTLFVRLTRKILLTDAGQTLYSVVNESFNRIMEVCESLDHSTHNETLNVSLTPYFSAKWLTVRLSRFWASHPDIDLRLHHTSSPGNYEQGEFDIAITWGQDDWSGLDTRLLLSARVVPVCSPGIITQERPLNTIDDLYQFTLLHENDYSLWTLWLKRAGIGDVNLQRGSTMDDANVILKAAIDGQGVALGADVLLKEELESGKLVMPFDPALSMNYSYYIVYPSGSLDRPRVNAFCKWLMQEADGDQQ